MSKKVNKKNKKKINKKEKKIKKTYFSFGTRVFIYCFTFVILFIGCIFLLLKSFDFVKEESISYSEKSNLDYKVYLKRNDFYEEPFLGKNMVYIANLIDEIGIDFNYSFIADTNINLNFSYDIVGKLVIADETGKNTYFQKEYKLLENKKINMENYNVQTISESINIDYGYYNSLANKFKMSYGVDTVSNLIVYLMINKDNSSNEEYIISNSSLMSITIPLSERSIDIEMDYTEINNTNTIISKSNVLMDNIVYLIIAVFALILSIVFLIKSIRLIMLTRNKKNVYDKYINKIINEYDRLIVETTTSPDLTKLNVIKVNKFEELLDVRDNLKLPIMYYTVVKHQKCQLYIKHNEDLYIMTIKAIDLEEKDEK